MKRVRVRAYGRVQGVSFRWYAQQHARSLRLAGWVRNCPDGSVEAMAEGEDRAVEDFVGWMHHGPAAAQVDRVEVTGEDPEGSDHGFSIRA